jgi:site-specific recombinase XerD
VSIHQENTSLICTDNNNLSTKNINLMALTCTNVTLRQRVISNGRISLYLDYYPAIRNPYTMKMSRREYLGIYIYARPKNEIERDFNNEMLSKAEAIRCIRVQAIVNEEFGFLDKHKMKADFLAYFREKAKLKYHKWDCVYQHFEKFVNGYCTFGDVTVELCQKFRQYLLNCKQIRHPNISVSRNSAAGYFSTFRALLKVAYQEKMLRENLNDFIDKIEWKEVKKQYLTLAEVKKLAATPCKIPVLKQASLFSCMTGLRISDILQLTWDNIEVGPDNGYYIRICTEKTETEATLPISNEALELCGIPGSGCVFKGLTRAMTNQPLKQWISEAGIKKHITFHCFRHSYAVIQISLGTDIYTVSKMLTHKNVSTTQIYADLVNSKKRETANKISLK